MDLEGVGALIESGAYPDALSALDPFFYDNPDDPRALYLLGLIMLNSEKPTIAYQIFSRLTHLAPKQPNVWLNMGKAADDLYRYEEAERHFRKVLSLRKDDPLALANMSSVNVRQCKPDAAIVWAKRALKADPDLKSAVLNLGFSKLMRFDFSGWEEYEAGLGITKYRDEKFYGSEPRWDGLPVDNLIVYAEQGIGDQIAMAGAIFDVEKDVRNVVLDVAPKMVNLFKRTFGLETHGDQYKSGIPEWAEARFSANCSLSSLQKYYRSDASKYTGEPFLAADPHRVTAVQAMLDGISDRPKVGISWTGGLTDTGRAERSTTLDMLEPLLGLPLDFVSLEYKDHGKELDGRIHDFPWLTQTQDYDDTAALVECLDLVISVPQSVVHLAGGLGTDCWVIQCPKPHFFFGVTGETPLYNSVKQYRRKGGDWGAVIERIRRDLVERYALAGMSTKV